MLTVMEYCIALADHALKRGPSVEEYFGCSNCGFQSDNNASTLKISR